MKEVDTGIWPKNIRCIDGQRRTYEKIEDWKKEAKQRYNDLKGWNYDLWLAKIK